METDYIGEAEINAPYKALERFKYFSDTGELSAHEVNVAVEKPLEMYINKNPYTVTMRSPPIDPKPDDDDFALIAGFVFTEGLYEDYERDVNEICICPHFPPGKRVVLFLQGAAKERYLTSGAADRATYKSLSSCGVCGKQDSKEIIVALAPVLKWDQVSTSVMEACMKQFDKKQSLFHDTGMTHAASLFSLSGDFLAAGEDIGRHNALDKAIGKVLMAGNCQREQVYMAVLSSRISFEMMQKAVRIGCQVVAAVSGASSQAVALAEKYSVTLIGYWRRGNFVVYTNPQRLACHEEELPPATKKPKT